MHVPVFIDIGLDEQAEELRAYFKGTHTIHTLFIVFYIISFSFTKS
jgi:hypothetical protein